MQAAYLSGIGLNALLAGDPSAPLYEKWDLIAMGILGAVVSAFVLFILLTS